MSKAPKREKSFISNSADCYATFDFDLYRDTHARAQQQEDGVEEKLERKYTSIGSAVEDLTGNEHVDAQERLSCLLELSTVSEDNDHYTDWVGVPTLQPGNNARYTLSGLTRYFEHTNWARVPDPLRNFNRIDFMSKRIRAFNALPDEIKRLPGEALTVDRKKTLCRTMINGWLAGNPVTLLDYHVFLGLSSFTQNNAIFLNTNQYGANDILGVVGVPKAFLVRESVKNHGDGRGHATVFTFSYNTTKKVDGVYQVQHCRCLAVHGVGVYLLNSPVLPCTTGIAFMPCMQTLSITDILADCVKKGASVSPAYHSIGEMLLHQHTSGLIDLSKIVLPAEFANDVSDNEVADSVVADNEVADSVVADDEVKQ